MAHLVAMYPMSIEDPEQELPFGPLQMRYNQECILIGLLRLFPHSACSGLIRASGYMVRSLSLQEQAPTLSFLMIQCESYRSFISTPTEDHMSRELEGRTSHTGSHTGVSEFLALPHKSWLFARTEEWRGPRLTD